MRNFMWGALPLRTLLGLSLLANLALAAAVLRRKSRMQPDLPQAAFFIKNRVLPAGSTRFYHWYSGVTQRYFGSITSLPPM